MGMNETTSQTQGWTQKYTKNKPLRKAKETVYAGISVKWFYIIFFWAFVSILAACPLFLFHNIIVQSLNIALILGWWAIYLMYFRTCEHYEESMTILKFMLEEYLGHHQVTKFSLEVETLQSYIPIVDVLPGGLVRFTLNRYGKLIRYWPLPDPGDDVAMEKHLMNVQAIFNRLSGDMMACFIGSSRFGTASPLLKKIEKKLNNPKTPKQNLALWKSQYDKLKTGKVTPDWAFYAFLGLGTHETPEKAQEMLLNELPNFMDGFENAGILAEEIRDKNELVKSYIQFMVPRDLI
jgi:hypothetical protein